MPANVEVLYEQLVLHAGVLNDVEGKLDLIVGRAVQFADKQNLDGLIFPGAPREVLNPNLSDAFAAALKIPVATALRASAAALTTFAAKRILLLTPFDPSLNRLIRDFLGRFDLIAISPGETLPHYTDALKLSSDDVIAYARRAIIDQREVDAIYFQGAVLDPTELSRTDGARIESAGGREQSGAALVHALQARLETSALWLRQTIGSLARFTCWLRQRLRSKLTMIESIKAWQIVLWKKGGQRGFPHLRFPSMRLFPGPCISSRRVWAAY